MNKGKCSNELDKKAKAFVDLLYAQGDKGLMAKLYDIFHWETLSDTQALARTELWQELEYSLEESKKQRG